MGNKRAAADVITTCQHTILNENIELQNNTLLKPNTWDRNLREGDIQSKMESLITQSKIMFCRFRYNYIQQIFAIYKSEDKELVEEKNRISVVTK